MSTMCADCKFRYLLKFAHDVIQENQADTMHFILIDGTWSNSGAMFKRLQVWQQTVC